MIHEEAFNVLFGENIFWFRCSARAFGGYKPESTRNIPRDNLKKMEQMEIEVNQDHFLCNRTAICSVIKSATMYDDSLRLLRLHFRCNNHTGFPQVREKWWNRGGFDPSRSVEVMEALCRVAVRQTIEVKLTIDRESEGEELQAWVDAVAGTKGWTMRMTKRVDTFKLVNGLLAEDEDDAQEERLKIIQTFTQYVWVWVLEPQR